MNDTNRAISCEIRNCAYHCKDCDFCSLDHIKIGTHEANPTKPECTDCESFLYRG